MHAGKFIPDVETHNIHPTVKSLNFEIETWVILTYTSNGLYSKIIVLVVSVSPSPLGTNLGFELGLGWTGLGLGLGGMGNKGCRPGLDKKLGCCGCWSVAYCLRMGNTLNLR